MRYMLLELSALCGLVACGGADRFDQDGDGFVDCIAATEHTWPRYRNPFDCEQPRDWQLDTASGLHWSDYPYGEFDPTVHDCDDSDPDVHPGVEDVCDGIDNDCDGPADGRDPDNVGMDCDGDGFSTFPSDGAEEDCDDNDAARFPGNPELCDGVDNDCNLVPDDNDSCGRDTAVDVVPTGDPGCQCSSGGQARTGTLWLLLPLVWLRRKRGFGLVPFLMLACLFAGCASDPYDQDHDGYLDCERIWNDDVRLSDHGCFDKDGDIIPSVNDCNDVDDPTDPERSGAYVHPDAGEVCDGIDNDCDGLLDGADPDCPNPDCDGDGRLGIETDPLILPDCDDNDENRSPDLVEICDGIDNDCDGWIDNIDGCDAGPMPTDDGPAWEWISGGGGCNHASHLPMSFGCLLLGLLPLRRRPARS